VGSEVPPRASSGAGRFANGGRGGPAARQLAELHSQVTFRAAGGDVAGGPPPAPPPYHPGHLCVRSASARYLTQRLLLTGACARRSRASRFCCGTRGCAARPGSRTAGR
jgi:hypothetical protein